MSRTAWGSDSKTGSSDSLPLAHLTHAVSAAGVEEKLCIDFCELRMDGASDLSLRCKAYVGPQAALMEGFGDKSRLRELRLDFHGSKAVAELPVSGTQEPWAIRIKLYRRPASNLFAQEIWHL